MATDQQFAGCVIASSNRFNDIRPYCNRLYAEDPKRWGNIMPWEFPQGTTGEKPEALKEKEQIFLRKFFTDSEIYMQGGADGDGAGFKFLKQVWYSIAIYNWQTRVPALADWWVKENQDVLKAPEMLEHMLNPDALPRTFFHARELALYGESFLRCTIKVIQWYLNPPKEHQPSETDKKPSTTASVAAESTESDKVNAQSHAATDKSTAESMPTPPGPSSAPLSAPVPFKGDAQSFTPQLSMLVPTATQGTSATQPRTFSGEMYPTQDLRYQQPRKRGTGNKRNSFTDRSGYRPGEWRDTQSQAGTMPFAAPTPTYGGVGSYGPPPPQNRGPPFVSASNPPQYMPTVPHPQHMNGPPPPGVFGGPPGVAAPPGFPPHYPAGPPPMANPSAYHPGIPGSMPPYYNAPQPFADRSNGQRNFSHESSFANMDGRFDHAPKQRRNSMSSRGSKRGGYNNAGRGRGSRGRNSIDQESDYSGPGFGYPPNDRRPSMPQTDKSWRGRPGSSHDENAFPSGDARLSQPPNRPYGAPAGEFGAPPQMPTAAYTQAPPGVFSKPPSYDRNFTDFRSIRQPCPDRICSKNDIGEHCQHPIKLIVFNIPGHVDDAKIHDFFSSFGELQNVRRSIHNKAATTSSGAHVFLTFRSAANARACLKSSGEPHGNPWGSNSEVAREIWDVNGRENFAGSTRDHRISSGAYVPQPAMRLEAPLSYGPPPPRPNEPAGATTPHATDLSLGVLGSEAPSGDTTPTASGPGTPRKSQKKKKKPSKSSGLREESLDHAFEMNALKPRQAVGRQAISPVPEEPGNEGSGTTADHKRSDTPVGDSSTADQSYSGDRPATSEVTPQKSVVEQGTATPDIPTPSQVLDSADNKSTVSLAPEKLVAAASEKQLTQEVSPPIGSTKVEEPVDDSFLTADDTPGEDKEAVIHKEDITLADAQKEQTVEASASTEATIGAAEVSQAAEEVERSTPTPTESKKVAVPQIHSKGKTVQILPPIDTGKAAAKESDQADKPDKSPSSVQQRTVSGDSGPPSSSFVTAPNTPAVLEPPTQEPQQTKVAKTKGPSETESFSVFGNSKKSKKSKGPKGQGSIKINKGQGSQLPLPLPAGFAAPVDAGKISPPLSRDQPKQKQKQQTKTPEEEDEANRIATGAGANDKRIAGVAQVPRENPRAESSSVSSSVEATTSPQRDSFLNRMGQAFRDKFMGPTAQAPKETVMGEPALKNAAELAETSKLPAKSSSQQAQHTAPQDHAKPAGLDPVNKVNDGEYHAETADVSSETAAATHKAEEAEKSKKSNSKNKKKKKSGKDIKSPTPDSEANAAEKPKDSQAPAAAPKATLVEMSHPAKSNELRSPFVEFKGSEAVSDASSPSLASSSPSRMKLVSQKPSHVLGAESKRIRPKQPRVASSKGSDTTSSADETAVTKSGSTNDTSNMGDMRQPNSEELAGLLMDNSDNQSDFQGGEKYDKAEEHVVSDETKKMQEKLRKMEEDEKKIKAAKAAKKDAK